MREYVNREDYKTSKFSGVDAWQHKVSAEEYLGFSIPHGYQVHHIDSVRSNNAPENLVLMEYHEHSRMHALGRIEYSRQVARGVVENYFEFITRFFKTYIKQNHIPVFRCDLASSTYKALFSNETDSELCGGGVGVDRHDDVVDAVPDAQIGEDVGNVALVVEGGERQHA